MGKDDLERTQSQERNARWAGPLKWAALVLVGVSVATALGFFMVPKGGHAASEEAAPDQNPAKDQLSYKLFRTWPGKPDLALVLSAQQHGYMQPCGCSEPQKGGLARRYNFVQSLRKQGWPVISADLGDIPQRTGPQALLKYSISMRALKLIDYTAVGIGENEMLMPLFNALGEYALNNPSPRVLAANLVDKENKFPGMVESTMVRDGQAGVPKVGLVSAVGPSVAQKSQDPDVRFVDAKIVLPAAVRELQGKKAELLVLLYQGTGKEAMDCAGSFPQIHVILCLSESEDPSERADKAQNSNTMIVSVGHKGKYVGVVGAFRTKNPQQPFDLQYQLVAMDPEYETPQGRDQDNPIHALLQEYAEKVRDDRYLSKYILNARHPVQVALPKAEYVGSEKCKDCHQSAYKIWKESPHPRAYNTLVKNAKRPNLRQYDGECVVCHVIGFGYKTGFTGEQKTPHLRGVGCENCHGPSSLHVQQPNNPQFKAAINPWKVNAPNPKVLANRIDATCQKCHDGDNSVHFKFEEYWEKMNIAHPNPPAQNPPAQKAK